MTVGLGVKKEITVQVTTILRNIAMTESVLRKKFSFSIEKFALICRAVLLLN